MALSYSCRETALVSTSRVLAVGRHLRELLVGDRRAFLGARLLELLVHFGRVDVGELLALPDRRSDVDVPGLEVAVRPRVDGSVGEGLDVAGKHELALRVAGRGRHHVDDRRGRGVRPIPQPRLVVHAAHDADDRGDDGGDAGHGEEPLAARGVRRRAHALLSSGGRGALPAVREPEDRRHEEERGAGRQQKAADHRAAQRSVLLAAFAEAEGHRDHADDHGERRHEDGTEPREARLDRRGGRVASLGELLLGEADDENAVGRRDAHAHDRAGQGRHRQRRMDQEEHPHDSRDGRRERRDDDERIEPRLEVHDDQQVDEDDRDHEPTEKSPERLPHRQDLSADDETRAAGQLLLRSVDDLLHRARHACRGRCRPRRRRRR